MSKALVPHTAIQLGHSTLPHKLHSPIRLIKDKSCTFNWVESIQCSIWVLEEIEVSKGGDLL